MTSKPANESRSSRNRYRVFAIGVGVVAAIAVAVALLAARWPAPDDVHAWFTVENGPLTISVTESGTIKPSEQEIIKSQIEGRTTILSLIPEGTRVEKGDLLIELDASDLQDRKVDQAIRSQNAEAAFIQARENLAVVKNQAESDIDTAALNLRFAREDFSQYRQGEYPNLLKERQANITLAEEELQRSEEKLKWSRILFNEQYVAQSELQADELSVKKAQLDLELAQSGLNLLTNFTYPRQVVELESGVKQAQMTLERVRRSSAADVVQAEANLRAKESEFKRQQDKLQNLNAQIAKARITATRDGLVIYATSTQFHWHGNDEPLAEGQEVRERQELIHLPTASTFIAEVSIHESSLDRIRVGLPVRITVDALPGQAFAGTVQTIAPLPDPTSVFLNPDLKVYRTEVSIDGGGDVLRTGMSCDIEIVVDQYEDAIYVPLQCVIRIDDRLTTFVEGPEGPVARPVSLGLDNNRMVHVLDGLATGERVLLTPPLNEASTGRGRAREKKAP